MSGLSCHDALLQTCLSVESRSFGQDKRSDDRRGAFGQEGGFRERMTKLRMEQREALQTAKAAEPPAPSCPACGKPMTIRKAKTGPNAGNKFWGCTGYPTCKAIQEVEP